MEFVMKINSREIYKIMDFASLLNFISLSSQVPNTKKNRDIKIIRRSTPQLKLNDYLLE